MKLEKNDYIQILEHYNIIVPKTKKNNVDLIKTKKLVHRLLSSKLCNCIKKVQKSSRLNEPGAIIVCNKSIFTKRNLKHYRFTCKNKFNLKNKKGTRYFITKTQDKIKLLKKSIKANNKK